jgi:HK97 family phage prohead protease
MKLEIRGYALPFDQEAIVEGVRETVAPGAFEMCWDVALHYGEHGGHRIARRDDASLSLFQDRYGLAFQAYLEDDRAGVTCFNAIARGAFSGASVNFVRMQADEKVFGCLFHRRITKARIDHIALTNRPCYENTGVWPAFNPEDLPPRFRDLARRWNLGKALSSQRSPRASYSRGVSTAASARQRARVDGTPASSLSSFMSWEEQRRRIIELGFAHFVPQGSH